MLSEFRAFIARGNVLDLAVAVLIGAAFGKIVSSLTDDILMPLIGKVSGGIDFSSHFLVLGPVPPGYRGSLTDYVALKKAGASLLGWGEFVTQVVNFLIVAFVIFLLVRAVNRAVTRFEGERAAVPPAADPAEILLLREIRDELRARPAGTLPLEGQ